MAVAGCLFRLVKAGFAALQGDSEKVVNELENAIDAVHRPSFSVL